jgi:polyhydroxyalkanoate synthesis regulator phasin
MVIAIAVTVWIWRAGRMLDATREMATLKSQVEALEKRVVALERR